jgi:hypothetical protein
MKTLLPTIAETLAPFMKETPLKEQPLLLALLERLAGDRYRAWASEVKGEAASTLQKCAEREDEVARLIESLYPAAAAVQARIRERIPDIAGRARALFSVHTLTEQFELQAQGERLGAATWRSLSRRLSDARARDVLVACAALDDENAIALEAIIGTSRPT